MKKLLYTLFIIPLIALGQVPQGINYQAVAYDANGFELANQEISIRIGILLVAADAESSYSETHQITTNNFGLFSLVISQGNSTDDFSSLNWENGAFLKVEIDENLDGEYVLMGVSSFNAVPYALYAKSSGTPGTEGPEGPQGIQGETGEQGLQGIQGETGEQGLQGIQGEIGEQGLQGIQGETGEQGLQGIQGEPADPVDYELLTDILVNDSTLIETFLYQIDSLKNTLDAVSQYFGCKDHDACNYDATATMSNNSCTYATEGYYCSGECIDTDTDGVCDLDEVEGCTDATACNYVLGATNEDGSCQYNDEYYNCQGDCENDDDGDGTCDELEEGCTDEQANNFNPQVLNSTNCIYSGCMDNTSGNYNPMANQDDGSCIPAEACTYPEYLEYDSTAASFSEVLCQTIAIYGCTDATALNYNSQANSDDSSCEYIYGCTENEADNYNIEATTDDGTCIYYGCTDQTAGNYDETANTDNGTCLIGGCINDTAENYNADAGINDGTCIIYGCTLSSFPNYNSVATIGDGSCNMNSVDIYGCTDSSTWTYQDDASIDNGTCYYGPLPEIGDLILGGIVFYVDETGQHGLISAVEDLPETYPWGCSGYSIDGANETSLGSGLQNTLDIATQCGGNNAAQASLNAEIDWYTDWYLPSEGELLEMYHTIGNGGSEGNLGGFITDEGEPIASYRRNFYWSSTEKGNHFNEPNYGSGVQFHNGNQFFNSKSQTFKVRVIRTF